MTRPVVVAICGDPGGANAVAPVIEGLRCEGRVDVRAMAYREAQLLWAKRDMAFEVVSETTTSAVAQDLLQRFNGSLVLAGTSSNPTELEKQFIVASRVVGIPSLAVLDFWSNYSQRFGDREGRLLYMPDRIAVMDESARDEMVKEGFDGRRLVITGQPAFDDFTTWRSGFTSEKRHRIRAEIGVGPSALLVVFASQPLSDLYGDNSQHPSYLGYTEKTVLRMLLGSLQAISQKHQREIVMAVRPHPRERCIKRPDVRSEAVHIAVVTAGDSRDLIMAADLVVGMNTMLLVEACYLGCLTVSLQPGLRHVDPLPTNRLGFSRGVYQEEHIRQVLEGLLLDESIRAAAFERLSYLYPYTNATQCVMHLAYEMIGLRQHG